ncbi:subclass B3 metallo-beta-lactamase [Niabella ginsenosidivorans]|uniref:subclass B3 metallo-beta-lactamase n=1 Tax=Niabella ginsenosidivorans TaxID=1176587 RepID=UPI0008FCACED|nr:subclass B3 metallo-beta-lactamase [Niabella ginsenosidivorans]
MTHRRRTLITRYPLFPKSILLARWCLLLLGVLLLGGTSWSQKLRPPQDTPPEWSRPYPPFRIAGNLYYVGTYDLACYLITTTKGNILINTGLPGSVPIIQKNIKTLGFQWKDLKILLTTQAHFDHVGAMAAIKKLTGAQLMADAKDAAVLADGGSSDYAFGGKGALFTPVMADKRLQDGDTIILGETRLTMLHHPGHTQGSCSYLLTTRDEERTYRVLIANMPTIVTEKKFSAVPAYPEIAQDYAYTLGALKKLSFDLWVASHASQFGLQKKHPPFSKYNPLAFADKKGYEAMVDGLSRAYQKKLEQDQ